MTRGDPTATVTTMQPSIAVRQIPSPATAGVPTSQDSGAFLASVFAKECRNALPVVRTRTGSQTLRCHTAGNDLLEQLVDGRFT